MRDMASIEVATAWGSIRRPVLRIGASLLMVTALVALVAQGVMTAFWDRWLT
jgi:hypothetical protein